jgi:type I restriction enzyme M protein
MVGVTGQRMSQRELESYLWGVATKLRGLVDATDYKQYVFPLLFFKRLSDVWDEDYQRAFDETRDEGFARDTANDRFLLPEGCHWSDVRSVASDLGRALVNAFQAIEVGNAERLSGIFGSAAWTDKTQMPDANLKELIEHLSERRLDLATVPEDELGNGYEYLIKQFADDSGHTAQEFYTNRTVVHLMSQMLEPQAGESIYDPTCGTGGMLISSLVEVKRQGGDYRTLGLFGQELIATTSAIARMNLVLHGVEDFHIATGNTLSSPAFTEGDHLKTFDMVMANPPYSIKKWKREAWHHDPWGRNFLGTPPKGRADYAFLQHILKSLDPAAGRCAILFPHGVLFRNEEAQLRRRLVESDLLECVVGLGPNLFYNSPMRACIVVCRSTKPVSRQGKVLFIDALGEVSRDRSQSFLGTGHQNRIVNAYRSFADEVGFARVIDADMLLSNESRLSISLYVPPKASGQLEAHGDANSIWAELEVRGTDFWTKMSELSNALEPLTDEGASGG